MSRSRNYVFTVNNYTDEDEHQCWALPYEAKDCKYICVGKEIGESGTHHLQGYIYFNQPKSLNQLKDFFPTAHFEVRRGTHQQASDYCKKDGDYFEWGTLPVDDCGAAGKESEQARWADAIKAYGEGRYDEIAPDILVRAGKGLANANMLLKLQHHDNKTIQGSLQMVNEWRYGETGTGKSKPYREAHESGEISLCLKPANKWWCNYKGEEYVMIEDFDKRHDCLAHFIKIWGDRYSFEAEVKGSCLCKPIRPKHIIITSNYHPKDIWTDPSDYEPIMRRFKIVHCLGTVGMDVVVNS